MHLNLKESRTTIYVFLFCTKLNNLPQSQILIESIIILRKYTSVESNHSEVNTRKEINELKTEILLHAS